jgi:GT2 family glycosyltransferase
MDVSVIIVSYNNKKLLQDCLHSVVENTKGVSYEIIVVDNSSRDGSQDMLRESYPNVTLLCNKENAGFSRANNQGYKLSSGKCLLFLNSDTLILGNAIEKMAMHLKENPTMGILGPRIVNTDHQPTRSYMRFLDAKKLFLGSKRLRFFVDVEKYRLHFPEYDYSTIRKVPWLSGACLMIKRKVFEEAGLFDEHYFFYLEDVDLCLQVNRLGYDVVYFPVVAIIHMFGGSSRQHPDHLHRLYDKSMAYYFRKNMPGIQYLFALLYIRLFSDFLHRHREDS